jgi:DNA-directed RNA polymerase subunit RPC12/RpoP
MKKRQEGGKAKCPKCQAEYDVLDDAPIKAMGGLCAACWHEVHIENKKLKVEGQKVVDKS